MSAMMFFFLSVLFGHWVFWGCRYDDNVYDTLVD
jgi:hypothetical protein